MIKLHENLKKLLDLYPINNFDVNNIKNLELLHKKSIKDIVDNGGSLPIVPPFEKNPFIKPLNRKEEINGLIIGTFPPINYLCDTVKQEKLIFENNSDKRLKQLELNYFNSPVFWNATPINVDKIINTKRNNHATKIEAQLKTYKIACTDLIQYCQRKLKVSYETKKLSYSSGNNELYNMVLNEDIIDFLTNNHVDRLLFTSSSIIDKFKFFDKNQQYSLSNNNAFQLFLKLAHSKGLKIDIKIPYTKFNWICINEKQNLTKKELTRINNILQYKVHVIIQLSNNKVCKQYNVFSCLLPSTKTNSIVNQDNLCVRKYALINNIATNDADKLLFKEIINAFFNNQIDEICNYNI